MISKNNLIYFLVNLLLFYLLTKISFNVFVYNYDVFNRNKMYLVIFNITAFLIQVLINYTYLFYKKESIKFYIIITIILIIVYLVLNYGVYSHLYET